MRHYVLIDGVLQLSTPSTSRWMQRAAKQVPAADEAKDAEAIREDRLTAWEILEGLDETE